MQLKWTSGVKVCVMTDPRTSDWMGNVLFYPVFIFDLSENSIECFVLTYRLIKNVHIKKKKE